MKVRRPRTRAECIDSPRPCPWVGCRHHLALEVVGQRVVQNHRGVEVWEMGETCSLDVADDGEHTLDEVAPMLEITKEWVRQIEIMALLKIRGL